MKIQIKKVEEGKWEIEIDEQQLLDFLTIVFEKLSQTNKGELVSDEVINKVIDQFLGRGKEEG